MSNEAGERKMVSDAGAGGAGGEAGRWSGEATRAGGGFATEDQKVSIQFGEEQSRARESKEVPKWMTESTVNTGRVKLYLHMITTYCIKDVSSSLPSLGPGIDMVHEDEMMDDEPGQDDEITNLLLRHERTNKDKVIIPGDDTDSDKSDDSDVEQNDDNDAALLASLSAVNNDKDDDDVVEVMEDGSDDNDDIPTITVAGEEYDITDVTPDVIAKMSPEEMEKYNQLYQDFYKDMF